MRFQRLGVALLAMFALGAIVVNSALAKNDFSETGGQWYTGASPGTKVPQGTTKDFASLTGGATNFSGTYGAGNLPLKLHATSVTANKCSVINVSTTSPFKATTDCESRIYNGVTVVEPPNCTLVGGSIKTKPITGIVGMNGAKTNMTIRYTAQSGATIATFEIEGEKCAAAGLYKVTGALYARALNATGVFAKKQKIESSAAIQESAGEVTSLKIGEKPAFIEETLEGTLEGEVEWAAKES